MDYDKLIERLRECGTYGFKQEECRDAALAIETLRADLARVTAERDGYKIYYNDLSSKPDCNTCEKRDCEYRPRVGGTVRANCPLYSGPEKEANS